MQVPVLLLAAFRHGLYLPLPASALHGCAGVAFVIHFEMYGVSIQVHNVNVLSRGRKFTALAELYGDRERLKMLT